jgi:hypothetical protein
MKKILFALTVLSIISLNSFAQTNKHGKFSVGLEGGLPVGNVKTTHSFAAGASLKYDLPIANNTAFTASAGYTFLEGKNIPGYSDYAPYKEGALKFIPVKGGIKYNMIQGLYAEAQVGAALSVTNDYKIAFVYAPGIGYNFGDKVDFGVRYEGWSISSGVIGQIAARLAYSF